MFFFLFRGRWVENLLHYSDTRFFVVFISVEKTSSTSSSKRYGIKVYVLFVLILLIGRFEEGDNGNK